MALLPTQQASSSTSRYTHHVFLSFRGEDTHRTFIDHLYTAMMQAGFRTFRDNDEISRGHSINAELHKAIQQSGISVIVFSKDYASSRWCLDEVVIINGRRRTSGHVILPIFYDVDPSDVRKQAGSIGEAFARYEEQAKAETDHKTKKEWKEKIKEWRAVLREVADLAGMDLRNQAHGHESKFIQKIVQVVEDKLNRKILNVARCRVGINSRSENINMWLQDGSANVNILVIYGMGGIGKTTIAKFVYNVNIQRFDAGSFLENVREISKQPSGLLRLQSQVLSNILKMRKQKIYNVDEGVVKIKDAVASKKILLVLDDVDKVNQLDALLGTREFYSGSKIIITTRDKWLLKAHEVHKLQTVEELDENESLELFSWHAFGQDHPFEGYMEQSKRVVHRCGGLPLAHEVLGSSLFGKSINVWESAIKKYEAIPDAQIQKKLEISYESLPDDHDKNLFLHIACFFVGKDKDDITKILDKCDFFTIVGIESLIDRCLVTIDEDNKLMMHQLLQQMGREIVRKESPKELGKRSRLWHHEDSFNVLKEKRGTKRIEGLILDMHLFKKDMYAKSSSNVSNSKKRRYEEFLNNSLLRKEAELKSDAFARMDKLRILQLNYVQLKGCYENFPRKLRWLCWHGFPLKSIPNDFPLDNLVALDMCYSKLERLWEGTKYLGSLKILNVSYSQKLSKTPDFSKLPNAEKVILKGCVSLVEICESIVFIEGLTLLNLKDCVNLRKLPNISVLKCLEILIISGCSNLGEIPKELRNMESLKVLHVDGFTINRLPTAAGGVKWWNSFIFSWVSKPRKSPETLWASIPHSLLRLSLKECNLSDDSFPRNSSKLSLLQELNLSKNPICSLPDWVKNLSSLKVLYLNSCAKLQSVLDLPSVKTLFVGGSTSIERITSSSLSVTKDIEFTNLPKLEEIQGFFKLEPIEKVETEIINNLGLFDLGVTGNVEVEFHCIVGSRIKKYPFQALSIVGSCIKKYPSQILYEFGIFSTFVPGREIPSWFSDKNKGSSLSFIVPSRPNLKIKGFCVCFVYALSNIVEIWTPHPLLIKISNKSKHLNWIYSPACYRIPKANEDFLWLSHWKFGNLVESGDEVYVLIVTGDGFQVKQCGINIVYDEQEKEFQDNNTSTYLCWEEIIGGDLSKFQLSTGEYFLSHHGFHTRDGDFLEYANWTTTSWWQKLFSDSIRYEELKYWGWFGGPKGWPAYISKIKTWRPMPIED